MMQQHAQQRPSASRRNRRQPQPEQRLRRRSCDAKRLRGSCSGDSVVVVVREHLHDATAPQPSSSDRRSSGHTMRHRPSQHIAPSQPIGVAGRLSSATLVEAARRQRRPRAANLASLARRLLLEQTMNWPQFGHTTDRQQTAQISPSLASSSLARQLMCRQQQRIVPTDNNNNNNNTDSPPPASTTANDAMQVIKSRSKIHQWHWSDPDASQERLLSDDKLEVCFHPECAESTAAIRGSQAFRQNGNYYYWEITIYDKLFGTSMMLGLCTDEQILQKSDYCNLIGLDKHGWSLSHKGLIWHDGKYSKFTNDFTTNQTLTIGLLFDTMRGELSYFLNGENLGVAFSGLNNCNKDLYPVVGSTAKRTRMRLTSSYCGYVSLFERTCYTIMKSVKNEAELVQTLQDNRIPKNLIDHITELSQVCRSQTEKTAKNAQCADH